MTQAPTRIGMVLAFVLAATPLVIAPGFLFTFDVTPKVILLVAGCAALLLLRPNVAALLARARGRWFAWLIAAQLVSLLISTVLSTHPGLSLLGSTWRRFGLITHAGIAVLALISAAYVAADRTRLTLLLRALCVAGLLAALYGCAQYLGFDPWLPRAAYIIGEGQFAIIRPPSTLGHASYAATFYLQAVFAGAALARIDTTRWRMLGWLMAALGSVAIVLSGTRGAMVGWMAGAAVLAWLLRPAITGRRLLLIAMFGAVGVVFYLSPAGLMLRARTRWSTEDPRGGARLNLWKDAAVMGFARPLQGWGPEAFVTEFPHYQSRELAREFPDFYHESPHNIFLEAFTAQGIAGLLILIALCGAAFAARPQHASGRYLLAGFVAIAVSLQFVSFTAPTAWAFYFTLGVLVALDPAESTAPTRAAASTFWRVAPYPLALLFAAYALHTAASDRALDSVRALLEAGRLDDSVRVFAKYRDWQRPGFGTRSITGPTAGVWFSRALTDAISRQPNPMAKLQALQAALNAAQDATRNAEDPQNASYTLAQIHSLREDLPAVEQSLRQAIAAAPMWFKPHWTLAEALLADGDARASKMEARREAEIAADLDAGKDPEVTETLARARAAAEMSRVRQRP